MEVTIHANVCDSRTREASETLCHIFRDLSARLEGNYGGTIECLLVHFELLEYFSGKDGKPKRAFRFQKRVSGRSKLGLPRVPDKHNVGYYSVRPDFCKVVSLSGDTLINYALSTIYQSTEILLAKQSKLGGFNAELFRQKFVTGCEQLGFNIGQ